MTHKLPIEVFVSSSSDPESTALASKVTEQLRNNGLSTFLSATDVGLGNLFQDSVVGAMNQAVAMVAVIGKEESSPKWLTVEIGMALGLGKPIFVVSPIPQPPLPVDVRAIRQFTFSQIKELADAIQEIIKSEIVIDTKHIQTAYSKTGVSADRILSSRSQLIKFVTNLEKITGQEVDFDLAIRSLARARKSGLLRRLAPRKKAIPIRAARKKVSPSKAIKKKTAQKKSNRKKSKKLFLASKVAVREKFTKKKVLSKKASRKKAAKKKSVNRER